jgi:hypothetical protein
MERNVLIAPLYYGLASDTMLYPTFCIKEHLEAKVDKLALHPFCSRHTISSRFTDEVVLNDFRASPTSDSFLLTFFVLASYNQKSHKIMSTFFQPPPGSSGSRTIYTVLHERAQSRDDDESKVSQLYSPAPSSSSLSSTSGSSCAPTSAPSTPSPSTNGDDYSEDWMDFDATDADQLNAFVPASLGQAIDAARYSSLGDFGTEICWEALPPIFALPKFKRDERSNNSLAEGIDDVPLVSELSEEQQRIVMEYLDEYRSCAAAVDKVNKVAARANL